VSNAGPFEVAAGPGSTLQLVDFDGLPAAQLDFTAIDCDDGIDNDLDGLIDSSDAECDATNDASERLTGIQEQLPARIPIQVDAAGTVTVEPSEMVFQPQEECALVDESTVWCLLLTVEGDGPAQTGSVQSNGIITIPWPVHISVDATVGYPGLAEGCQIGPINAVLGASTYDFDTGETTLEASDVTVPATTTCGSPWDDFINGALGLPSLSDSHVPATILNPEGQPIAMSE
jgi:hypothetical protein